MTAEIAILNNSGIALAADSAVTIGGQKVYNSANKLFTLSKYEPVGIMVYASADLMGIPWEIIIKRYRSELGKTNFKTLKEYSEHFWAFLRTNEELIPSDVKENYVLALTYHYLQVIYDELQGIVETQISSGGQTSLENSLSHLKRIIDEGERIIEKIGFIPGFNKDDAKKLFKMLGGKLEEAISTSLGKLYELLDQDHKNKLKESISRLFFIDRFYLNSTGVVIAGYGTSEFFPKIETHIVEGIFENKIKRIFDKEKSNTHEHKFVTSIIPFAQDEMVFTFIAGIDPEINIFIHKLISNVFDKYPDILKKAALGLDDETITSITDLLAKDGKKLYEDFRKKLAAFKSKNNINPILNMVGHLPKDELAAVAESLVNLTVFKRKVSNVVETVGGPIDVAIISKGDGFIWVKRKHYFKPELNQNFFSNYFGEAEKNDKKRIK